MKNREIKFAPLLSKKIRLNPFEKLTIPVDFLVNKYSNLNRKSMWLKPRKCAKLTLKNHEIKFAPLLSKNQIESFEKLTIPVDFLVNKYSNLNRKSMWLKPRKCAKLTLKNQEIKFAPLLSKNQIESFWETDYTSRFLGQQVFKFE